MNIIWLLMMLASAGALIFVNPEGLLNEMIGASTAAVTLCIELLAVYTVFLGLLEILDKSGLSAKLARLLRPVIKRLYKTTDEEIEKLIAINMSANMMGLGNAATPSGMRAIRKMDDGSGVATRDMIMLLIVNATSIQLLPTTVIGLRASAGSTAPSDIILPTFIATVITTITGITLVLLCDKFKKYLKRKRGTK